MEPMEYSQLGRQPRRGDVVMARNPANGEIHPMRCLVMGVASHMDRLRVTLQPKGRTNTLVVDADLLIYCPDETWEPAVATQERRGTAMQGLLIAPAQMRRLAIRRKTIARRSVNS